jgi:hypothetical protein
MRGPPVRLRDLTAEEACAVASLARSRTASARRVERARILWRASTTAGFLRYPCGR